MDELKEKSSKKAYIQRRAQGSFLFIEELNKADLCPRYSRVRRSYPFYKADSLAISKNLVYTKDSHRTFRLPPGFFYP